MILYIEDYSRKIEVFLIKSNLVVLSDLLVYRTSYTDKILDDLQIVYFEANGLDVFYCLQELIKFKYCRYYLCRKYSKGKGLYIKVVPPEKEPLDYLGNFIALKIVWEKIEIENLMSWLSTLGGGYSALGENLSHCAKAAGKISLQQLQLGIRIGDPFVQARCKLYFSISLIQMGRLKTAAKIIRQQYKFAKAHKDIDKKLIKICQGIWLKLQYEYMSRKKNLVCKIK